MSVELLELAAGALGGLVDRVVFLGGATVPLWITDPAAPGLRVTEDVDVVVDVASRLDLHSFEDDLREAGFRNDQTSGVICRWRHEPSDLVLDAMAARAEIQGFASGWQRAAIPTATETTLPSGKTIRVASPPYLLAMKLEAFADRGRGDFYGSRDFADIVALISGRAELIVEVESDVSAREYIAVRMTELLRHPRMRDGVIGALPTEEDRVEDIVLPGMRRLAGETT